MLTTGDDSTSRSDEGFSREVAADEADGGVIALGDIGRGLPGAHRGVFWGKVLLLGVILTLPNALAAVMGEKRAMAQMLFVQGLALLLLPAAFGMNLGKLMRFWLPVTLLVPAAAGFVIMTGHQPTEWALLLLSEANGDEFSEFAASIIAALIGAPLCFLGGARADAALVERGCLFAAFGESHCDPGGARSHGARVCSDWPQPRMATHKTETDAYVPFFDGAGCFAVLGGPAGVGESR